MVALQIRGVPDDVRDVLTEKARAQGKSLQAFLLSLVEDEAQRSGNHAVLARFAGRSDGSRVSEGETANELKNFRSQRDQTLGDC